MSNLKRKQGDEGAIDEDAPPLSRTLFDNDMHPETTTSIAAEYTPPGDTSNMNIDTTQPPTSTNLDSSAASDTVSAPAATNTAVSAPPNANANPVSNNAMESTDPAMMHDPTPTNPTPTNPTNPPISYAARAANNVRYTKNGYQVSARAPAALTTYQHKLTLELNFKNQPGKGFPRRDKVIPRLASVIAPEAVTSVITDNYHQRYMIEFRTRADLTKYVDTPFEWEYQGHNYTNALEYCGYVSTALKIDHLFASVSNEAVEAAFTNKDVASVKSVAQKHKGTEWLTGLRFINVRHRRSWIPPTSVHLKPTDADRPISFPVLQAGIHDEFDRQEVGGQPTAREPAPHVTPALRNAKRDQRNVNRPPPRPSTSSAGYVSLHSSADDIRANMSTIDEDPQEDVETRPRDKIMLIGDSLLNHVSVHESLIHLRNAALPKMKHMTRSGQTTHGAVNELAARSCDPEIQRVVVMLGTNDANDARELDTNTRTHITSLNTTMQEKYPNAEIYAVKVPQAVVRNKTNERAINKRFKKRDRPIVYECFEQNRLAYNAIIEDIYGDKTLNLPISGEDLEMYHDFLHLSNMAWETHMGIIAGI